jgi:hypothetical protein
MPRGGMITLDPSVGSQLTMIVNAPPDRSGGVGGWQSTDRARQRPSKWWGSQPGDTLSWDLTIDLYAIGGPSVERRLVVLREMGLARGDDDPPTIKITGDVWPRDAGMTWVMQNVTLGARQLGAGGAIIQQQVTVDLERFDPTPTIAGVGPRSARGSGGKKKRRNRTVRSRQNDTVRAIALRELGNATRWRDVRTWNKKLKKVDPDARLHAGTKVTIKV